VSQNSAPWNPCGVGTGASLSRPGDRPPSRRSRLPPTRVVSLAASSTEIACALDCGGLLVGRSHECDYPAWVCRLPAVTSPIFGAGPLELGTGPVDPALAGQALSLHRVNTGALARLAPDVVITQAPGGREAEEALRGLLTGRTRLVALESGTLAGVWRDMRRVADALGVPERGVQLVSRLVRRTRAIAERATVLPRPRVACLAGVAPLVVAGHWTPELIALAGAEEVLARPGEAPRPVTLEALAAADPDAIFVMPCGFDLARTREAMPALEREPLWCGLRAVREGSVFLADGSALFQRPGPRVAEALEVLAEALRPGAFRFGHEGRNWEKRRLAPAKAA
jgi:iron complex transport system substrate-binding protein